MWKNQTCKRRVVTERKIRLKLKDQVLFAPGVEWKENSGET